MTKAVFIFLLASSCSIAIGQTRKGFIQQLDSIVHVNPYIADNDYKSFLKDKEIDKVLDVNDINQDLIDATVFFLANLKRARAGKEPLKYCQKLQAVAINHVNYFNSKKFINEPKKRAYFEKSTSQILDSLAIDYGMMKYAVARPNAVKYKRSRTYYHALHSETSTGLYYGERPGIKDSLKNKKPVKNYTYRELGKEISNEWFSKQNKKDASNKGYEFGACSVKIDLITLNRKRIPAAATILVLGAFKTRLINASLTQTK
jgi:hypothetical protein